MVRLKMPGKEVSVIACILLCGQASGMGDRWAWRSHVSSRRSQLETDTDINGLGRHSGLKIKVSQLFTSQIKRKMRAQELQGR